MRRCDNCGREIPVGANKIEVRVIGFQVKGADFCRPKCFEEFYSKTRYSLLEKERKR